MKKILLASAMLAFCATAASAAGAKSYQVTGPVLALTDSAITVQKGTEKWEIARDKSTTVPDTVKVGSKVTVQYTMSALSVEDKSPAPKAAAAPKADSTAKTKGK